MGNEPRRQLEKAHVGDRSKQLNKDRTRKQHLGTTFGRQLGGHIWEEAEDNETTTRPGTNTWETKSKRQLKDHMWEIDQRQLNDDRKAKQQLGTTSGRQLGDHIWKTSRTQQREHICKKPGKQLKTTRL